MDAEMTLAERLERGELVAFSPCPFALPDGADRTFLFDQQLESSKKNISYHPRRRTLAGFRRRSAEQSTRLCDLLADFSTHATAWLTRLLPQYIDGLSPDRATFRPEEEAIRKLRPTARNDLLHIDAFPSRPTLGRRILRLFVNIHPSEPRIWATSDSFDRILAEHGQAIGLPGQHADNWAARLGQGLLSIFQPGSEKRTVYDRFMLRMHHYLKTNDRFQERAPRRFWRFAPNTAWLLFTDGTSHADLRGRFALEHSYFVERSVLTLPGESPAALLEKICGTPVLPRAA